jgi:hypothetical protein
MKGRKYLPIKNYLTNFAKALITTQTIAIKASAVSISAALP